MKTLEGLKKLEQEHLDAMKKELKTTFDNLKSGHENSKITRINSSCFTLNHSDLGNNWTPEHHDFSIQYEVILNKLSHCLSVTSFVNFIKECLSTGKIKVNKSYTINLHKEVVAKLAQLAG